MVSTLAGGGSVGGVASGFADGLGSAALFSSPGGLACDAAGAQLWVADTANNRVRALAVASGAVSTVAGGAVPGAANGLGTAATLRGPVAVAIDTAATTLYIADAGNNLIRSLALAGGAVTTLAGGGSAGGTASGGAAGFGSGALFAAPLALAVAATSSSAALLLVVDGGSSSNRLRAVNLTTSYAWTLAGGAWSNAAAGFGGSAGTGAVFSAPVGVAATQAGAWLTDGGNAVLRRLVAVPSAPTDASRMTRPVTLATSASSG